MESRAIRLAVFLVATIGLLWVSRKSLRVVGSHGFFRFFAWEFILALILINIPVWFSNPFSIQQIGSWVILTASLFVLVPGVYLLRTAGKPSERRSDLTLFPIEKTTTLVTSGVFRYIRHPLYASLLFLAWGAFLKDLSWYSFILVAAATVSLTATAKADEAECLRYFGSRYEEYRSTTKMFVPFVF